MKTHVTPQVLSACGVWGVGSKNEDSSLQEGASHTYTLRLDYSRISILYKKKKNWNKIK